MDKSYNDIIIIEAYDGNELDKYDDIILPKHKIQQNKYQLACSLSHIKAIIHSYEKGDEEALILEDDISNEYVLKWDKSIEEIVKNAPKDCECLSLFCSKVESMEYMSNLDNDYCKWTPQYWSTSCYYINKKGMKKIYDLFYKEGKIDLSIKLHNYVADDGVIYNNLITYNYTKPTYINKMFKSIIGSHYDHEINIHNYIKNYFENK
jgi:GR25 family glycosyltransferase involved in LPS biosynthesis